MPLKCKQTKSRTWKIIHVLPVSLEKCPLLCLLNALEKWPYQLVAVFQLQEVILARKIVLTAAADQAGVPHEI